MIGPPPFWFQTQNRYSITQNGGFIFTVKAPQFKGQKQFLFHHNRFEKDVFKAVLREEKRVWQFDYISFFLRIKNVLALSYAQHRCSQELSVVDLDSCSLFFIT